jgi:hypothetical protein
MLSFMLFTGCSKEPETKSNAEFVVELQQKATALGQHELARFNAADLLYKGIPELHTTEVPIIHTKQHAWVKTYRRFTEFEVVDITQSKSLISPITYTISYRFDQFSTLERATNEFENALELAEKDTGFEFQWSDSFTRDYLCDEEGNLVNLYPQGLDRPIYFRDRSSSVGHSE